MVSGNLALPIFFSFLGSNPNRGQSPVEWGDFVCPSVCPYVRLSPSLGHPAKPEAWLAGPEAWLAGPQAWLDGPEGGDRRTDVRTDGRTDGRTYGRTYKISPFYRTSSPIGAAAQKGWLDLLIVFNQGQNKAVYTAVSVACGWAGAVW